MSLRMTINKCSNYEEVLVKTEDGYTHKCWYVKARNHKNKPVILYFPGNGEYLEKYVRTFDYITNRVDANIFSCPNRGCGTNEETPSEEYFYKDAYIYLNHLKQSKRNKIFIFGSSMGAAVALETASKYQNDVYGLILQNPFLSMKRMAHDKKPFLYFFLFNYDLLIRTRMDNEKTIKNLHIPILFNVSEKDEMVSTEHSKILYETCPSNNKFMYIAKNGIHDNILINDKGEYHQSMKIFIETAIALKDVNKKKEENKNR
ncbi:BEM46-like protein, putative [Plasmodium malariae]|uniref:BEM46-like protein, putative n=1 Tax=Plasmodium malariae TaxID=5858 RepID=A0A1D3TDX8_PLAMA|nr:BEM46-like protein, putative [Plasmodium malariae]SCP03085.1 BEM46-like protein, putative [Plasmodium malariae]